MLSEYPGYTDETLLDVTWDRFQQMVDVITERKRRTELSSAKWDLGTAELMVKGVGSLLPGLARTKKGANAMEKAVQKISFRDLLDSKEEKEKAKEDRVPSTAAVMQAFGLRPDGLAGVRG